MKKITIISLGTETASSLKKQLKNILKENVNIECYSINTEMLEINDTDLIVFSSEKVANIFLENRKITKKYLIVRRVIQAELIDKLLKLEKGTKVLLVNDTEETCEIAIKQLKGHGVDHIIYYSYYPGIKSYETQKIAITPGEEAFVPKEVENTINIGAREIDIVSIMEIIIYLGGIEDYADLMSSYFFRKIVKQYKKYIETANKSTKLTRILSDVLDNSIEGIIYINAKEEVLVFNKIAKEMLKLSENIIGKNIYELYPNIKNDLITIENNEVFISTKKIYSKNELMGYMIILETSSIIEKLDEERRRKKKHNKNNARYSFDDMIGNNAEIVKMIKLSKKISKTNSTVLIQGESGTGKEILAQAIHNESNRKNNPFVAINFSALSENLLESELFGYEEGAFTGAQKGGKIGLFKKAHKGTIFLDEIGDAPYHFQTRLLRVLQEREVTPVGSTEPIPIDVRVIAATNKDLVEEVRNKRFREDLFYRINVMPIYTVNLRNRKDDIEILIKYYLRRYNVDIKLEEFMEADVISFLKKYNWPGNIRELVNMTEYLVNIKEDNVKICIDDLPKYIMRNSIIYNNKEEKYHENNLSKDIYVNHNMINYNTKDNINKEILRGNTIENELWVLNKVYEYSGIGRRALFKMAKEENLNLGEGKIRGILNKLCTLGYIEINKGVKGTKILEKGIAILLKG